MYMRVTENENERKKNWGRKYVFTILLLGLSHAANVKYVRCGWRDRGRERREKKNTTEKDREKESNFSVQKLAARVCARRMHVLYCIHSSIICREKKERENVSYLDCEL